MTYERVDFSDSKQLQGRMERYGSNLDLETRFEEIEVNSLRYLGGLRDIDVYREVENLTEAILDGLLDSKFPGKQDREKYREYSIHARDLLRLVDGLKQDRLIEITPRSELASCLDQLDRKSSKRPHRLASRPIVVKYHG